MKTVILLTIANIFMTFAWYGHLKYKTSPLWIAIVVSWMIAFVDRLLDRSELQPTILGSKSLHSNCRSIEYCFQVPANRIGSYQYSTAQLKTIQEIITLIVFCGFSVLYLKEDLKWNYMVGFALMIGSVFFIFKEW